MRLLMILLFTWVLHVNGWGQNEVLLYYNGFEELPVFEGEIPENDSLEISITTDYSPTDWNHWSPRLHIVRTVYDYDGDWFPSYNLTSGLGEYNVANYDSLYLETNASVYNCGTQHDGFAVKAVINDVDTITVLAKDYFDWGASECGGSWGDVCNRTMYLSNTNIQSVSFYLDIKVSAYNYQYYNAYSTCKNIKIDDISIYGYTSEDLPTDYCQYDANNDGNIGAQDLLAFLEVYGTFVNCD